MVHALESVLGKHRKDNNEIFKEIMMQSLASQSPPPGLEDPHCLGINKESNQKISLN